MMREWKREHWKNLSMEEIVLESDWDRRLGERREKVKEREGISRMSVWKKCSREKMR
jgi:hypothetical protein